MIYGIILNIRYNLENKKTKNKIGRESSINFMQENKKTLKKEWKCKIK